MVQTSKDILHWLEQRAAGRPGEWITRQRFPRGARLITQDASVPQLYVITEGIVKCYIREENGKDYILEFLGEGETLGEMELIRQAKSLCHVEAITDLVVYKLTGNVFRSLMEKDGRFSHLLLRELADRLHNTAMRASYQQSYPSEYAMLKLLDLISRLPFALAKKDLAGYTGTTIRNFNRTLKKFRDQQIIREEKGKLLVAGDRLAHLFRKYEQDS